MKHRILIGCGIAILVLGSLFGCGSDQQTQPEETTKEEQVQAEEQTPASAEEQAQEGGQAQQTQETGQAQQTQEGGQTQQAQPVQNEADAAAQPAGSNTGNLISEDDAKVIALKDAGVKESDVNGFRIRLETDNGIQEYEVDFYAGNKEYDYDLDAQSGDVRSRDTDIEDDFSPDMNAGKSTGSSNSGISEKKAKKIALARVKGAGNSDIRIHIDNDDGRQVYEGSIVYNEREYDFEIDASTGNITEWEEESVYDD